MTTLILSVICSISASAYDVEVDGIYYLIPKKNLAIVTSGDEKYSGDITIPSSIKVNDATYTVTIIRTSAFSGCSGLTSVTIPNSVTSIEDYAFIGCSGLTSVTIPNSVTSIGKSTFSGCRSLTSVTIPNSVTNIENKTFDGCRSLTSVTIPNSVTSIGEWAFYNCSSLTSVTIPNSVTSIGDAAFHNCSSLTSVTIPNSVSKIGKSAFSSCSHLENVYCYAEKFSKLENDIFKDSYIEYATLHVPSSAISYYQTTSPWSGFGTIKALEGTGGETKKCETPTISFVDGKLTFSCATEEVEYESEVTCSDVNKYYSNEINLAACYDITVTAMKSGFSNSDIATAKLYWLISSGSLDETSINSVSMRGITIQSDGGFITISGLDNDETVSFYAIDGKNLGFSTAINGTTFFTAQTGSVVVAKIGNESIKILVK